jgi:hypothetical protein
MDHEDSTSYQTNTLLSLHQTATCSHHIPTVSQHSPTAISYKIIFYFPSIDKQQKNQINLQNKKISSLATCTSLHFHPIYGHGNA